MFNNERYPFIRAFEGSDGKTYYISFFADGATGFSVEDLPGTEIINFCEMDLAVYKRRLNELKNTQYSFDKYEKLREQAWGIAGLLKDKHRYIYFFTTFDLEHIFSKPVYAEEDNWEKVLDEYYKSDIGNAVNILEEVVTLQEIFKFAIDLCLNKDNMPDRHVAEKLLGFLYQYREFNKFVLKSGYALMPAKDGFLDYERVKYMNDNGISDTKQQLKIINSDSKNLSVMNYYIIEHLYEMLYFEFMQIMKHGGQVKICKNCGKYFILPDNRKREYCDRIFKDGKTCKEIGAAAVYKNSLGNNESPLKIAQREYNKMYSRMSRSLDKPSDKKLNRDLSEEAFKAWVKVYSAAKKDYKDGKISGEEFLNIIQRN